MEVVLNSSASIATRRRGPDSKRMADLPVRSVHRRNTGVGMEDSSDGWGDLLGGRGRWYLDEADYVISGVTVPPSYSTVQYLALYTLSLLS